MKENEINEIDKNVVRKLKTMEPPDKMIRCRRIYPSVYISLIECGKCEFNKGMQVTQQAKNGRPPVLDIKCSVPALVRVEYMIKGRVL